MPHSGGRHFNAPQWGHGTSMPHSGTWCFNASQWGNVTAMPNSGGLAFQCPSVGAWHFSAPQWGHGTSVPHRGGTALQCPTVGAWHFNAPQWGRGTSMPHSGGMPLQRPTVGAWHVIRSRSRAPRDRFPHSPVWAQAFRSFPTLGNLAKQCAGRSQSGSGGLDRIPQPRPGGPWWGFQSEGYWTPRTKASSSDWGPGMVSTEERSTARSPVDPVH